MDKLNDVTKEFFNQIFVGIKNYIGEEKLNCIITQIIEHSKDISNTMLNISKIIANIFSETIDDEKNEKEINDNNNNNFFLSYYNSNLNETKKAIFEELCDYLKIKKDITQIMFNRDVYRLKEKYKVFVKYKKQLGNISGFNIIIPDEKGKKYLYKYKGNHKEEKYLYLKCVQTNCNGQIKIFKENLKIINMHKHNIEHSEHYFIKDEFNPDFI